METLKKQNSANIKWNNAGNPVGEGDVLVYTKSGRFMFGHYEKNKWYDCCNNDLNVTHWAWLDKPEKDG